MTYPEQEWSAILTINGTESKFGYNVSWSNVLGLEEDKVVAMPNILAISELRDLRQSILMRNDVKKYPHLSGLSLPKLPDKTMALLIGADIQAAHRSRELRAGED